MNAEFFSVKITNISLSNVGFVIFLKTESQEKVMPICIGAAEVNSISAALSSQQFPRPLSHTFFKNILTELKCSITKVQVTDLIDGTFYGRVFLKTPEGEKDFDARPSDAIALALRYDAPIYVKNEVFLDSAVDLPEFTEKVETETSPLENLKKKLEKAIEDEHYEEAALIREQIQQLEMDDLLNN